jgi:hypothetical protein
MAQQQLIPKYQYLKNPKKITVIKILFELKKKEKKKVK